MSYSVVVVDDEPPARAKLQRWLGELPEFRVAAEAGDVAEAIAAVSAVRPDVLYLDIQLGTNSGFDVVEGLRDSGGFAADRLHDRVLGVRGARLRRASARLPSEAVRPRPIPDEHRARARRARRARSQRRRGTRPAAARAAPWSRVSRAANLSCATVERAIFSPCATIDRIAAAGNYVEVHVAGKVHLIRESLTKLHRAARCRGVLARPSLARRAVGFISELRPMFHGDYELVLRDGSPCRSAAATRRCFPQRFASAFERYCGSGGALVGLHAVPGLPPRAVMMSRMAFGICPHD